MSNNFTTYTIQGSSTTKCIYGAPLSVINLYHYLDNKGYNIAKVRNTKVRYGKTVGNCMTGFHFGLVSVYKENAKPKKQTSFGNTLQLTEYNNLSILRLPRNVDIEYVLRAIDKLEDKYTQPSFLDRIRSWLPQVA